jgi:hypothetical protein
VGCTSWSLPSIGCREDGGSPRLRRLGLANGNCSVGARVALRGKPVDRVGGPHGVMVSEDAEFVLELGTDSYTEVVPAP